jgi:hypothetical protein
MHLHLPPEMQRLCSCATMAESKGSDPRSPRAPSPGGLTRTREKGDGVGGWCETCTKSGGTWLGHSPTLSVPACLRPLSRCSASSAQTDRLLNNSSREVQTRPPHFQTSLSSGKPERFRNDWRTVSVVQWECVGAVEGVKLPCFSQETQEGTWSLRASGEPSTPRPEPLSAIALR